MSYAYLEKMIERLGTVRHSGNQTTGEAHTTSVTSGFNTCCPLINGVNDVTLYRVYQ